MRRLSTRTASRIPRRKENGGRCAAVFYRALTPRSFTIPSDVIGAAIVHLLARLFTCMDENKRENNASYQLEIFPDSIIFNFNFFLVLYCFYSIDFQLEDLIYRVVTAV